MGAVELRKENYNVWGYMMTMGLGYMEYFQLAEDLNAAPVPVMACGVCVRHARIMLTLRVAL